MLSLGVGEPRGVPVFDAVQVDCDQIMTFDLLEAS
jgi:hypothetical protein